MTKTKFLIGLVTFVLLGKASLAQDTTLNLSVKDAVQYALQHNKTLQNATLDIKKAEASRWQTLASMLPQVKTGFDYSNMCDYEIELMHIKMNPYGTFSLTTSIAITGSQIVGTIINNLSLEMSNISQKQTEQDIVKNVRSIYLSILVMEQTVSLLDSSLINLQSLEQTSLNSVKAGASEQVDADQIAIQVNSMKNNINSSKRNLELLYNSLILQLGTNVNTKIVLTGNLNDILNIDHTKSLLLEDFVLDSNYSYQLLKKSEQLYKHQVTMAYMNFVPTLSGYYQYSYKTYFGKDAGFNMTPPNVIGASISMPIFSSGVNTAKVSEAKINYLEAINNTQTTEDALLVQERQLRYNLVSALENYENQTANIDVSQRVFKNILNKYKVGMSSSLDVTNSSNNLITAQSNYIQAVLNLVNAQIELENLLNK